MVVAIWSDWEFIEMIRRCNFPFPRPPFGYAWTAQWRGRWRDWGCLAADSVDLTPASLGASSAHIG